MAEDLLNSVPPEDFPGWLQSIVAFVKNTTANSLHFQTVDKMIFDSEEVDIWPIIDSLRGSEITQIHFGGMKLRTKEMQRLTEVLSETKIEKINLADCTLQEDDVLNLINVLGKTRVTELDISRNHIQLKNNQLDDFMASLANSRITSLNFSENRISPVEKVSDFFRRLPGTQILNLGFSGFFIAYKMGISEYPNFRSIISHLQHSALTELNLANNIIDGSLVSAISDAIANSNIKKLDLSYNYLYDSGVNALVPGLVRSKVTHLNLRDNNINGENGLGNCLKRTKIRELNLTSNSITKRKMFSGPNFLQGSSVNVLKLEACFSKKKGIIFLPIRELKFSELSCLDLGSNGLKLEHVREIADVLSHTQLTHIDISYNDLCGECLRILGACLKRSKLTCISLRKTLKPDNDNSIILGVFSLLDEMKESAIVSVDLGYNLLRRGVEILAPVLATSQILALDLSQNCIGNSIVTLAEHLKFSTIIALDLTQNNLEGDDIGVLAECLKDTRIIILELGTNAVKSNGAKALAMTLRKTKLRYLDVKWSSIAPDGLKSLAEHIGGTCITHLLAEHGKLPPKRTVLSKRPKMIAIDSILWENRKKMQQFANLLKRTSFFTGDSNIFEFDRNFGDIDLPVFIDDCLKVYQMVHKEPHIVGSIEQDKCILELRNQACFKFKPSYPGSILNIFIEESELIEDCELIYQRVVEYPSSVQDTTAQNRDASFFSKQIMWLVLEKFPRKFVDFIGRRVEAEVDEHVSLLRKIEELGLTVMVELLLLNRPSYVIEESRNILHPYVYMLLLKYKQPICNLEIEPRGMEKIINYFSDHVDVDGAVEVISLLTRKTMA